ncbi:MAG: cytochrome c oxidase assembly protein [Candidatus Hodgkinia cicadicola]
MPQACNIFMASPSKRSIIVCASVVTSVTFMCLLIVRTYVQTCSFIQVDPTATSAVNEVNVMIFLEAHLSSPLAVSFKPVTSNVSVHLGEVIKVDYILRNNSPSSITAEAVYNVTPPWASRHFIKLECFCFKRIVLNPGSEVVLPLVFFIDPRIKLKSSFKSLTLTYFMNLIPSNFRFNPPSADIIPSFRQLTISNNY